MAEEVERLAPDVVVEIYDVCEKCGSSKFWVDCWNGCDEGWITDLFEQDPFWYDEDDMERCDICKGKAGWHVCATCHPESFDDA